MRRTLALIGAILATLLTITVTLQTTTETSSAAEIVEEIVACDRLNRQTPLETRVDFPCMDEVLLRVSVENSREVIEAITAMKDIVCHPFMHSIGRSLARYELEEVDEVLDWGYPRCNGGLLHGYIEAMDLTYAPDPAEEGFALCKRWAYQDALLGKGCEHGLGHNFLRNYRRGEDMRPAEDACMKGPDVMAKGSCLAGLYMSHEELTETLASTVEEVIDTCREARDRGACMIFRFDRVIVNWGSPSPELEQYLSECIPYEKPELGKRGRCGFYLGMTIGQMPVDGTRHLEGCSLDGEILEVCLQSVVEQYSWTLEETRRAELVDYICETYEYCPDPAALEAGV